MSLRKEIFFHTLSIQGQLRAIRLEQRVVVYEDDEEIAQGIEVVMYNLTDDITQADPDVKRLASIFWTHEFKESVADLIADPVSVLE